MTSSNLQSRVYMSRRANPNAVKRQSPVETEAEKRAKRLGRQQKRLEREMGISTSIVQAPRQRVVRFEDIKEFRPLTDTQHDFFESYEAEDATAYMLYGSAGTGKSFIALYHALLDIMNPDDDRYRKIVIVRSSVQSRDQGFLPGDQNEKMEAFEAPYHSILSDLTGKSDAYEKLKDMGKIEFASTSFLRGSTFNNTIVIFDEAQNTTASEFSTVATRIGRDCKFIVCGDGAQNDLTQKKTDVSGFRDIVNVTMKMEDFRHFRFTSDDIVRSGFVKAWIIACEKYGLI